MESDRDAFFRYTCRGLFERHKLLFSFQMCGKILEAAGKLNMDEYNFFLRGGVVCILLDFIFKILHLWKKDIRLYGVALFGLFLHSQLLKCSSNFRSM